MRISDILRLCLDNLNRRRGRTILTVIGVVIGTVSIIVMVSLGVGVAGIQEAQMSAWQDLTKITIFNRGGSEEEIILTDDSVEIFKQITNVTAVSPTYYSRLETKVLAGKKDKYEAHVWELVGMNSEAIEPFGINLKEGSYLTEMPKGKTIPVLVGENFAYNFEDTTKSYRSNKRRIDPWQTDENGNPPDPFFNPIKEKLKLSIVKQGQNANGEYEAQTVLEYDLEVVGIMKENYAAHQSTAQGIIMDIDTIKQIEKDFERKTKENIGYDEKKGYDEIVVKAEDGKYVEEIENTINDLGYNNTRSMISELEESQGFTNMIQLVLGGIGAVSLLVAAIGIANTMTMSIYERTREIGIMKVLGSKISEIRKMFLIEAALIGFFGGLVGVIISFAISMGINFIGGSVMGGGMPEMEISISVIPFWLVLLGFFFSIGVGLISGLVPANKAVKISALEAIRHD